MNALMGSPDWPLYFDRLADYLWIRRLEGTAVQACAANVYLLREGGMVETGVVAKQVEKQCQAGLIYECFLEALYDYSKQEALRYVAPSGGVALEVILMATGYFIQREIGSEDFVRRLRSEAHNARLEAAQELYGE